MVFSIFRNVCEQLRDSVAESTQQQRLLQQQYQQQQYQQQMYQQQHQQHFQQQQPSPSWGSLILPDKVTPSPLFSRLLDAIFDLAQPADPSAPAGLLTPTRLAAVYHELGYPDQDNLPLLLLRRAQQAGAARPRVRVDEGMRLAWRLSGLEHAEAGGDGTPGLTRAGFRALMVRDALIYPPGQAAAHSALLARRRGELGAAFPPGPIPAEALTPPGVPVSGDVATQAAYRAWQADWAAEYGRMYGEPGPAQQQAMMADSAEGWAMARQMQAFRHDMTMDGLSAGYRVPNGSGGYTYHYTGGLNW